MKQACRNFTAMLFATAFLAPVTLLAQKEDKVKEGKEKKEAEQIVITRKGDKKDKVVIEIEGDRVTVNGKPIDQLKEDGDISVRRNKIRDVWAYADGLRGGGFNGLEAMKAYELMDSNRAVLGVVTEKSGQGVEIQEITKESGAAKAGLKTGDVITKVGDKKIETPDELSTTIRQQKPGDKVTITYMRDNKVNTTTAELGKWKGTNLFKTFPAQGFDMKMDNFHLEDIMPNLDARPRNLPYGQAYSQNRGPKLGLSVQDTDDGKGVKVLEVDEDSNAAKAGIKDEDVITEINGKAVNSVDEVSKIIRESKDKPSVMVKLQRNGKTQNIEVKIPRKLKSADL